MFVALTLHVLHIIYHDNQNITTIFLQCKSRIDGHLFYLSTDDLIETWISEVKSFFPCESHVHNFTSEAECHTFLEEIKGKKLKALVEWKAGTGPGSMASEWCTAWGSCNEVQGMKNNSKFFRCDSISRIG